MKGTGGNILKLVGRIILSGIVLVLLTGILLVIYSLLYSKDEATLEIQDFSETKTVTLKPQKFYPYVMMNVWIEGYVDDSILIKLHSKENTPILRLKGEIKERWYTDYYGEGERTFIFDPYKATEGNLKIEYGL